MKKTLKEYTDTNFSGAKLLSDTRAEKPDAQGLKFIQKYFPNGFKSQQKAEQALRDHDASPIKARMGQYAPIFVHVQYHKFTDEAGQKYGVHQRQYYNSNFKEQDPKFNPGVTKLYFTRIVGNNQDEEIGTIIAITDEYVKDLQTLRSKGMLGQRVSENKTNKIKPIDKIIRQAIKEHLIREKVLSRKTRIDESVIGDLMIIAGESATFEKFTSELVKQKYIETKDLQDPETQKQLKTMYNSAVNESSTKSTNPITTRLREDTDYRKFFKSTMRMFGVESPKELSDKKKKEFFNYIEKNYKAKSE
jgi:hypothetical protein